MRKLLQGSAAAALALAAFAPGAAEAGLAYVAQERRVDAIAGTADFPPEPGGVRAEDSAAAGGFGTFDDTAAVEYLDPGDGDSTGSTASQRSTLGATGLTASGALAVGGDDRGVARSLFSVDFDLTADADYDLSLSAEYDPDGRAFEDRQLVTLRFARVEADGTETSLAAESYILEDLYNDGPLDFDQSGRLTAGRYALDVEFRAANPTGGGETAEYDFSLTTSDGDDGGGTPIPLPPAAWAGLGTFACYGAARLLGRRLRRA